LASFKYDRGISLDGPRETMNNLNQDNRCLVWDFKLGPREARSRDSVIGIATGYGLDD
jgi:hypothetical protein